MKQKMTITSNSKAQKISWIDWFMMTSSSMLCVLELLELTGTRNKTLPIRAASPELLKLYKSLMREKLCGTNLELWKFFRCTTLMKLSKDSIYLCRLRNRENILNYNYHSCSYFIYKSKVKIRMVFSAGRQPMLVRFGQMLCISLITIITFWLTDTQYPVTWNPFRTSVQVYACQMRKKKHRLRINHALSCWPCKNIH